MRSPPESRRYSGVTGRVSIASKNALGRRRRNSRRDNRRTMMTARSSLTVVLAAGEGTRMRSAMPKVLHPVAGQTLLAHVLRAAPKGPGAELAVVIGPNHEAVAQETRRIRPD